MKKISRFILLFLTLIFGCKQAPEYHIVFEETYSKEQVKELNKLVNSFEEILIANYGDGFTEYERIALFVDKLSKNEIGERFFYHNSGSSIYLFEKEHLRSGLFDEMWIKKKESDNSREEITLMERENYTSTHKTDVVDNFEPNMYGKYIESLKKVASNDKLVKDYLSAKDVAINLSNQQLGEGIKHSIEEGGFDVYFLKRILVAEVYVPVILSGT